MDFTDWRKSAREKELAAANRERRGRLANHIEAQIQEAQARGDFDNLPGMGQPLSFDSNPYAGEKSLGYSLLKSQGYAPPEVELAREIRRELEQLQKQQSSLVRRGQALRQRRVPPFLSEQRAYNRAVSGMLVHYETQLRELNKKILTLNLITPSAMHQPSLKVEDMLQQFRAACPSFP